MDAGNRNSTRASLREKGEFIDLCSFKNFLNYQSFCSLETITTYLFPKLKHRYAQIYAFFFTVPLQIVPALHTLINTQLNNKGELCADPEHSLCAAISSLGCYSENSSGLVLLWPQLHLLNSSWVPFFAIQSVETLSRQ